MSAGWKTATVGESIVPVAVAGKSKIQTKDYKNAGAYPIVDQAQAPIAGWTDSLDAVIDAPLPLIVFGDHSRTFKFLDQPFARGADGTQLLRPIDEIDPLFFFYACRAIDLPSRGYNRHFTVLKEKEISYPANGAAQRSIAALLSRVERAVVLQDELAALLEKVKAAAMQRLFSRGLRGEAEKETEIGPIPESWELVQLGSLGKIGNGTTPNRKNPAYWVGGTVPWVTSGRMYERQITGSEESVTAIAIREANLPMLRPGAVLMAIVGQGKTLGHCALLEVDATVSRHVGYIQPDPSTVDSGYLRGFLESRYQYLRQLASGFGSTRGALTGAMLKSLLVPLPPTVAEQREVVKVLDVLDRKIDLHRRKREALDQLFKSLLHKLTTGHLSVDDLDLSSLPKHEETAA